MIPLTHGDIHTMLTNCTNSRQVDEVLNKTYCKNDADKVEYLQTMFNLPRDRRDSHSKYHTIVRSIINHKIA